MKGSLLSRRAAVALAGAAVLALCLGGAAGSQATTAFNGAELQIDAFDLGAHSILGITVAVQDEITDNEAPGVAARVDVTTPVGYRLDLSGAPGQNVGQLIGVVMGADGSDPSLAIGSVVVDDPATWAADALAQTCSPGAHTALWRATPASPAGSPASTGFPIAVDAISGPTPADTTYVLHVCPSRAASTAFPHGLALEAISLLLTNVASVSTPSGLYNWSALVTPAAPATLAPQPSSAFELRAAQRRPSVLTLHARYEPKASTATITGKLEAAGAPWAGAPISLTEDDGSTGSTELGSIPTGADGSFSLRVPALQSETITATVDVQPHACSGPSTAPGGCLSETDSAPPSVDATVLVPRDTDPRQALRARDQALARASVLRPSDLPGGTDADSAPLPCASFTPNLHRLTETGAAASDVIQSGDQHTAAFAGAAVFRTSADARTDFTGQAQLAATRCEVRELGAGEGEQVLGIGPLRLPRVGTESRAFRAQVSDPLAGRLTIDLLFIRAGRVVITLHVYSTGSPDVPLDLQLARTLASRAAHGA